MRLLVHTKMLLFEFTITHNCKKTTSYTLSQQDIKESSLALYIENILHHDIFVFQQGDECVSIN